MEDWNKAQKHYWEIDSVKKNEDLEKRLNDPAYVRGHIIEGFKQFIIKEYIPWKYTDCRFTKGKIDKLKGWAETDAESLGKEIITYVDQIKQNNPFDETIIREGLSFYSHIDRVGIAGISGLLSLIRPDIFATVDRFVSEALMGIGLVSVHNPEDIHVNEAVEMERIMIEKSIELNSRFVSESWRPRDVDMILWSYGR